jgi:hypothetical protein
MNLPPNHNARLLSDQSGAPSTYATQQALQQEQSKAAVNAGTTSAQSAAMIMDKAREITAAMDTRSAQEDATVLAIATAKGVQANSGMPITNVGTDRVEIARRIYG